MNPFRRVQTLFQRQKLDAEMAEEMWLHVELQTDLNRKAGMDPDEARYAALRQFGNMAGIQETVREQHGWLRLEQMRQDLRFGARSLWTNPAYSFAVVLILALGIGTSTAMFSVVYGVLLDPYPYAKANEIWVPKVTDRKTGRAVGYRVADYTEIAKLPGVAAAMATSGDRVTISGDPFPDMIAAVRVSGTAFQFLGVPAALGRGLAPSDVGPNGVALPVTVLGYQFWQKRFDGDPNVIGRTIMLDDVPHVIVGVMPPRFAWYSADSIWTPLPTIDPQRWANPILRLKPGVSKEVAEQQLAALFRRLARETPDRFPKEGITVTLENYLDGTSTNGEMRASLKLLIFAVGFLLLITCTNVVNLQLARGSGRSREIAVRLAIGATRWRLIRQLLTESLVLSFVAGLLGCLLGYALTQLIVALLPQFYVPNETRVTMNGWVLFFTVGLSALAGIMTGLMPGFQCTRPNLNRALKEGSQGASSGERSVRTRNILVVTAIALSVVLLVGASLTIRGFAELYRHDWGFQPERLLLVRVPLPPHHYVTLRERNSFARDLLERTKLLPGVASVAYGFLPFHGGDALGYRLSGQPKLAGRTIAASLVSSDFRKTFGLTLKEGNDLTEQEVAHGEPVALISEAAAKLWPAGENPIGRMLELDALTAPSQPYNLAPAEPAKAVMVVGIVGDTRNANFRAEPLPAVYVPYTLRGLAIQQFVVRTQGFPMDLLPAFRGALRSLDKDLPLYRPITVDEIMGQQTTQPRFNMALFSGLGALALLLAATGIYSLLSFNVAQRTREIGVRMALGAEKHNIMQLIVRAGSRLLGIGMIIGLGGSFALTKIMKSQIVDLPSPGALDLIAVIIVLGIAALVASWLPARRAAKVDPVISLRAE